MFAKRKVTNGRDAGQIRSVRNTRPVSMPDFMRSETDGELLALIQRVKAGSSKPKLSPRRNRSEKAKRIPVTDEYGHVRSSVGEYIRGPYGSSFGKQGLYGGWKRELPPAPQVLETEHGTTQNASNDGEFRDNCVGVGLGIEDNSGSSVSCSRTDVDSVFATGIAKIERCKTTLAVFETYAKTYHDVFESVANVSSMANASTQTSTPKLQRTQMNLIYAGFWESCTWRQNKSMQTEDQNLTFTKPPTAMLQKNSSDQNWVKKFCDWKCFGMAFLTSAVVLGLMEIPNFIS